MRFFLFTTAIFISTLVASAAAALADGWINFPLTQLPPGGIPLTPGFDPTASDPPIAPHQRAELSTDAMQVVAGNNQFAFDIYQELLSSSDDNLLVSPFSISMALAMTYAGARGATAEQMANVLHFTLPDDRLHASYGELIQDLTSPRDGYELRTANRLFGQRGFDFQPAFLNTTGTRYQAPLEQLDFKNAPESSRKTINQWVSDQTNSRIPELLSPGIVTEDTRLVLTNAIYFNGKWKNKFDEQATQPRTFYANNASQTQVSMMSQTRSLRYVEQPGFQMLELPYAGDDLAMVVILPTEHDGLPALQKLLTAELWKSSVAKLSDTEVNVSIPKFTFDSEFKLKSVLRSMGMTDAFSEEANFSGITSNGGLEISDVIHKAFIAVNEEGTEAAAATAVVITALTSAYHPYEQPKEFLADHPFLFALEDLHSGEMLFMGRVTDPGVLVAAVPEPAAATLLAMGTLLAGIVIQRKRRATS